jgi:hypothetical protein
MNSSHLVRPQNVLHDMTTQVEMDPDEKLVGIRISKKNQRRLALQGYTGETYDQTLQGVLDKVETCTCYPRRLTR